MTQLFKSKRHPDFHPLVLPTKSEGARPAGQLGFTAPDRREWTVLVQRAPVVTPDAGAPPLVHLWLTLADREDGRTRRVGGAPFVLEREELTVDAAALTVDFTLMHAIEDAVAAAWGRLGSVPDAAPRLAEDLAALGLGETT